MAERKIVQIAVGLTAYEQSQGVVMREAPASLIVAVADDGTAWELNGKERKWSPLPALPQRLGGEG